MNLLRKIYENRWWVYAWSFGIASLLWIIDLIYGEVILDRVLTILESMV